MFYAESYTDTWKLDSTGSSQATCWDVRRHICIIELAVFFFFDLVVMLDDSWK